MSFFETRADGTRRSSIIKSYDRILLCCVNLFKKKNNVKSKGKNKMEEIRQMYERTIEDIAEHSRLLGELENNKYRIEVDIRLQQEFIQQKNQLLRQLSNQLQSPGPFEMDTFDIAERQRQISNLRSAEPPIMYTSLQRDCPIR